MINSVILAQIQSAVTELLTDTCLIEAETHGVDEMGAPTHSWQTVVTDVPCRIIDWGSISASGSAKVGEQETLVNTYRLIVPVGTPLAVDQRVTVGSETYHVVDIVASRTDGTDAQAVITRVDNG